MLALLQCSTNTLLQADRVHRVILLKLIFQVLEEKRDEIPEDFGIKLIELVINEMTREKVLEYSLCHCTVVVLSALFNIGCGA